MLRTWVFLYGISLIAADPLSLRQLEEKNRMFELRRALQPPAVNGAETLYYHAVAAGRFGNETLAIEELRNYLAGRGAAPLERKAFEELASDLVRSGHYGEAARAWDEALRRTPRKDSDRADMENSRALYGALGDTGPETVEFGKPSPVQAMRNELGSWNVPVEVNGRGAEWIFDTGAAISTLTESEAARMGLAVRNTEAYVRGSTGAKNPLRIAVAKDLLFGSARISNAVFLVLADQSLFVGGRYQVRGILGLPLIRALGKVIVSPRGLFQIEAGGGARGEPNLFFDGSSPILEVRHRDRREQLFLDTGANVTIIYPSFRTALGKDELGGLKSKKERSAGAGGIMTRRIDSFPALRLEISGKAVDLHGVSLLRTQPGGQARYRDGVLGMDALSGGFTLDFRAMQFSVE